MATSEKHKPLKAQACKNCVYAVEVGGKDRKVLICTNKEGSGGELSVAETRGWCRNFQSRKKKAQRVRTNQPEGGEIRFIPLTKGKVAIVDAADYEWLSKYKWHAVRCGQRFYAYRSRNKRSISMHRIIMGEPKGMVVDHIDGNALNNRRSNLRVCRVSENVYNCRGRKGSSRYKGVCRLKKLNKWKAEVMLNGRHIHIGCFDDEMEAAKAYDKKAVELFGEFAYLNLAEGKLERQKAKVER